MRFTHLQSDEDKKDDRWFKNTLISSLVIPTYSHLFQYICAVWQQSLKHRWAWEPFMNATEYLRVGCIPSACF